MSARSITNSTEGMIKIPHWNEKDDPVTDQDYPNIQEYVSSVDDPYWPDDSQSSSCMTEEAPTDG